MPKGVIINCGVRARHYTCDRAVGRLCGEENKAQAQQGLDLCKDGFFTGRGLHKFPLPPNSAALPCSQSQLCQHSRSAQRFRLRTPACFVFFPWRPTPAFSAICTVWVETFSLSLSFVTGIQFAPQLIPAVPRRSSETKVVSSLQGRHSHSIVGPRRCMPRRAWTMPS